MQRIFKNERHRNGPISANPFRTGQIFLPTALRSLDGAPLHLRERALPAKKSVSAGSAR